MVYRLRFLVQLSRASVSGLVERLELRSLASVIGLVDLRSLVSLKASVFSLVEGLGLRSLGLGGGKVFGYHLRLFVVRSPKPSHLHLQT